MVVPGGVGVAAVVLLGVLLLGIVAGRAKRRYGLLVAGLLAAVAAGAVVVSVSGPAGADRAAWIGALYPIVVPLLVAYVAGWLCARGSWFRRLVVLGVGVLLLAVFPYAAAVAATARLLAPH